MQALPKLQSLNGVKVYNDDISVASSKRTDNAGKKNGKPKLTAQDLNPPKEQPKFDTNRIDINSNQDYKIKNQDLENVAALFDCVKILIVEEKPQQSNSLSEQLENHIKSIMVDLGLTIKPNMHPSVKSTHNLKARFALFEIVFAKLIDYTRETNP